MKKLIPFLVSGILVVGTVGCQESAKTGSDTNGNTSEAPAAPAKEAAAKTESAAKTTGDALKGAADKTTTAATDAAKGAADKTTSAAKTATDATKGALDKTTTAAKTATDAAKGAVGKTTTAVQTATAGVKSLVLSKLEEKLPGSKLQVEEKEGAVTVKGTVPSEADLKKIEPLVKGLNNVKSVKVEAKVAPAKAQ
jgi:hyperosmotically inducible periplasmic protein